MDAHSAKDVQPLGLDLLLGDDSFINDLNPEDEALISGGGRRSRSRSRNQTRTPFDSSKSKCQYG